MVRWLLEKQEGNHRIKKNEYNNKAYDQRRNI